MGEKILAGHLRLVKPTLETPFQISRDWWEQAGRDFRVELRGHLCEEHRSVYEEYFDTEVIDWVDKKTGEVKKVRKEIYEEVYVPKKYWVRLGNVAINFRVVDTGTGRLLAAHSESGSYDSEEDRSFWEKLSDTRNLKPKSEILDGLSDDICKKFARMIAPYYTQEKRTIEPGQGSIGMGVKYAEAGLWPEAMEAWEQAITEMPNEPAGYYNLGLAYEVQGMLERAEASYKKAVGLKNKKLYMDALARIRKMQEEQRQLQQQRQNRD